MQAIFGQLSEFIRHAPFLRDAQDIPDCFVVRPVDTWDGDARAGALLFEGTFTNNGAQLALGDAGWEPQGVDPSWVAHMHGFSWLRDLREYAHTGGAARGQACAMAWMMILAWIEHYNDPKSMKRFFYRPDITGERLAMWISLYEFFAPERFDRRRDAYGGAYGGSSSKAQNPFSGNGDSYQPSNDDLHEQFFDAAFIQAQHLSRVVGEKLDAKTPGMQGVAALKAVRGLIYGALAFDRFDAWGAQALTRLRVEIDAQLLSDGAHASRCPSVLLDMLCVLLDIRGALTGAGQVVPDFIQRSINAIGPALRFYRYNDRRLGLFHGGQAGCDSRLDSALAQTGVRGKNIDGLPAAGFERITKGRTLLMFDCGVLAEKPYDRHAHAGVLSFEMSYAKQRVFVNCGSHHNDGDWRDALRAAPAHNCLTIADCDPCDMGASGGFSRVPSFVDHTRHEVDKACIVEASHDGFLRKTGFEHRRNIYMSADGYDIRGEDVLVRDTGRSAVDGQAAHVSIRFHLHPSVTVSLINDGREALLRLPGGVGWRFMHDGGALALENSIYIEHGDALRKTTQIVIEGIASADSNTIKWGLRKEG